MRNNVCMAASADSTTAQVQLFSKRKEEYKEFLEFTDTEPSKIIKHSSTRWLSLEKCVGRLLHHWSALTSYFNSHDEVEKPGRIKRCANYLSDHEMHLYYHFLSFILEPLNHFNTMFQADDACWFLEPEMTVLLRTFLGKFVKARVIQSHPDLTTVPYSDTANQLQRQHPLTDWPLYPIPTWQTTQMALAHQSLPI
ncbi:unnamed protein product [Mytilus edulis]|uniref:Uncharacterized protein n=1 Tax=Mytilus edulis TaxID=6550 RepID=A0A8S3QXW1_MYTED|nr:unnamed protein product [Mytilus edulis]